MSTNRIVSTDKGMGTVGLRKALSYDRMIRLFGGLWFLLLAFLAAAKIGASPADLWAARLSGFFLAVFYLLAALLIMSRSPAKAQADGLLPRAAAFVGTYMPWTITFFGKTDQPLPNLVSTALVLVGIVMMLVTVRHLGRSFSLVPQARSVVQTGPYRWIRHPLYLSEEIAIVGAALPFLTPLTVFILVVHFGVQVCRILYEEDLLRRTCPEYLSYEASRWRLIPYIW
jgi:protein-S-isoprenylcysteine O-methyltransferase Ste14